MRKTPPEIKAVFWSVTAIFSVFLLLPMAILLWQSLSVGGRPGLGNYVANIGDMAFLRAFGNSLGISLVSALISTALAYFLAYTVNHTAVPQWIRRLIGLMTLLPMFLPTITFGFVIIYAFGKQGLITGWLGGYQLLDIYGFKGMLLGYVLYTTPIAFLLINNTYRYIDKNYGLVSKVMGDGWLRTFYISSARPLAGTLAAACIQAFTLCFTDFGIPASIGGTFDVIAIHLYNEMLGSIPNIGGGATIAMVMLLPSLGGIVLIAWLERYNFRYNKISRQQVAPSLPRDAVCAAGSFLILGAVVCIFAVMFIIPFVKGWPYDTTFTWDNVSRILSSPNLLHVLQNTLAVAALTSVFGTAISFGASLVTARSDMGERYKRILTFTAILTNTIPGMVLGIAYLFAFSGTSLRNTVAILVVCNIVHYFATPYLMGKGSLEKLDRSWENTALLMGDSWFRTLVRVIIPNSVGTLVEMFAYYFINSMITVSAVIFLVGAHTGVLTTQIKSLQHLAKYDEIFVMSLLILTINLGVRCVCSRWSHSRLLQV